ncbi:MAG: S8/S53 family peptidase [Myxococcaceae bacterium]|nr:S8/S53 family peptidase [Myxococcaceae bacterium]
MGSQLFAESAGEWLVPPGLARFCAYDWEPAGSAPPSLEAVETLKTALAHKVERVDPERRAVAPLGTSATTEAAWQTLHTDFHAQTGRLETLPVDANSPPEQVRVAVVDSSPRSYSDGEAVEDRLGHGYAMGRIIRELGCPDGSAACISQVANHLALPQVTPTRRDPELGGYFGEQTQLARAIHSAVSDWRSYNLGSSTPETPGAQQPRMVVSLSLAWDGRYGGPYPGDQVEQLPAPARAVHAAITHAVCHGAVVIAAAGNDPGGPDEVKGPMFPAGWEQKPAPGPLQCASLEAPGYPGTVTYHLFPPAGLDVYQPLVFAVGGVRGDYRPLASTRPGGRPRLVAPGAHAVASDVGADGGVVPTDILTGSSVSAAVVSGVVSTLWGYRPELSGPEVMALVRQGSVDLEELADFCLGGDPCPLSATDPRRSIHRVSLCQALMKACEAGAGNCPDPTLLDDCPSRADSLPQLDASELAEIDSKLTLTVDGSLLDVDLPPVLPVCQHAALRALSWSYDETVCPLRQYYGIPLQPWTNPQPSKNPCTLCLMQVDNPESLAPSATLYISIDSEYSSRSLYDPTLRVNGKYEVDLSELLELSGQSELSAGDEVRVTNVPLDKAWFPIENAALTMRGEEAGISYSTFSELLLQ